MSCQNQRSQLQNKTKAMQILAARLAEKQREDQRAELEQLSGEKRGIDFGSQIRTYTLQPYQLVKDERTRFETGNVQAVLDGDLDGLIEAFLQWRAQPRECPDGLHGPVHSSARPPLTWCGPGSCDPEFGRVGG